MAAILGKQADEKLHLNAKVLCAKFWYKRADSLGGDSERTDKAKSTTPRPQ